MNNLNFNDFYKMSEMERLKNEDRFIHGAFINSYLLLTGKKNQDEFLEQEGLGLTVAHNILEINEDEVQGVIEYFAEKDDFDKCIELRDRNKI